jgi:hypothetical protein
MPSIEELLNEAELHMAAQPVNDVLEINPETREISIPDSEIILGVETDKKAERKYFHCPKIVGNNIDLSALELYVVFQNASNKEEGKDRYHVTDVKTTSDGYITFSWELSAKVTAYKGDVQFVVCAIKTDSSGVKKNVWNTTIAIGKCLIGLSSDMSASEEQSASDLYTQLVSELNSTASAKMTEVTTQIQTVGKNQVANVNSAGTTQVNNVQNKGTEVLASIPDTYTELDASVKKLNEQIRGKAPVIVESITSQSGKPVSVSDSAEMPLQGLRVYGKSEQVTTTGKNLCSIKSCQLSTNLVNSDVISWTKSSRVYYAFDTQNISGSEAYISIKYHDADNKKVGSNGATIVCDGTRKTGYFDGVYAGTDHSNIDLTTIEYISVQLGLYNDSTTSSFIDNIIVSGDKNVPYEPYTGGKPSPSPEYPQEIVSVGGNGSIDVGIVGKNLFGGKAFADKIVELGGTLQESDKTVHISANNIRNKEVFVFPDNSKQYTLIFNGKNTVSGTFVNMYVGYADGTRTNLNFVDNKKLILTTYKDKKIINLMGTWQDGEVSFYYDKCGIFEGVLTETDFKPYEYQSLSITTPTGLPAIPVPSGTSGITYTDADGQAWIADEIDFSRGKYVRRVWKGVFDGSSDEEWSVNANYFFCKKLPSNMSSREGFSNQYAGSKIRIGNRNEAIIIFDADYFENNLSNWKVHLASNPLVVMTYLDTPIETDLTQEQLQAYKSLTTFKPTSIISNDAGAQMEVEYACDTKTWVINKINTLIKEATTS